MWQFLCFFSFLFFLVFYCRKLKNIGFIKDTFICLPCVVIKKFIKMESHSKNGILFRL